MITQTFHTKPVLFLLSCALISIGKMVAMDEKTAKKLGKIGQQEINYSNECTGKTNAIKKLLSNGSKHPLLKYSKNYENIDTAVKNVTETWKPTTFYCGLTEAGGILVNTGLMIPLAYYAYKSLTQKFDGGFILVSLVPAIPGNLKVHEFKTSIINKLHKQGLERCEPHLKNLISLLKNKTLFTTDKELNNRFKEKNGDKDLEWDLKMLGYSFKDLSAIPNNPVEISGPSWNLHDAVQILGNQIKRGKKLLIEKNQKKE